MFWHLNKKYYFISFVFENIVSLHLSILFLILAILLFFIIKNINSHSGGPCIFINLL